jgi:hypothetical protein
LRRQGSQSIIGVLITACHLYEIISKFEYYWFRWFLEMYFSDYAATYFDMDKSVIIAYFDGSIREK